MQVLVVTSDPDPHVDLVRRHLAASHDIVLFDPLNFGPSFSASFKYDSTCYTQLLNGRLLDSVNSVWYRKPLLLEPRSISVPTQFQETVYQNYKSFVQWFISAFSDKLWVSDYWNIMRGNSKILQMQTASRLGFKVPNTLVTSSAEDAEDFVNRKKQCVVKPLNIDFVRSSDGDVSGSYVTRITSRRSVDYSGICVSPSIFQEEVVGKDLRVTVVGNSVFPCYIEKAGEMESAVDWRMGFYRGNISFCEAKSLPSSLIELCVKLVNTMGLRFGAIDFVRDPSGEYWFLEINPNGQWAFVEEATGMGISRSLAMLLSDR